MQCCYGTNKKKHFPRHLAGQKANRKNKLASKAERKSCELHKRKTLKSHSAKGKSTEMSLSFQSKRNSWHSKNSNKKKVVEKKTQNTKCRKRNTTRERSRRDSDSDSELQSKLQEAGIGEHDFQVALGWAGAEKKNWKSKKRKKTKKLNTNWRGQGVSLANCHRLNFNLCEKRTT